MDSPVWPKARLPRLESAIRAVVPRPGARKSRQEKPSRGGRGGERVSPSAYCEVKLVQLAHLVVARIHRLSPVSIVILPKVSVFYSPEQYYIISRGEWPYVGYPFQTILFARVLIF